jgi:hypothetical protein
VAIARFQRDLRIAEGIATVTGATVQSGVALLGSNVAQQQV